MKAYKVILELIKHPFKEVKMLSQYNITGIRYNDGLKYFTLDSISDEIEDENCINIREDENCLNIDDNLMIGKKFKIGHSVAYKKYPNICIGTISPDSRFFHDDTYIVFTSDEWFKHFPYSGGGPNSLSVKEDEIVLYSDNNNTKCVDEKELNEMATDIQKIMNEISVKLKEVKDQYLLEHSKTINDIKNTWVGN